MGKKKNLSFLTRSVLLEEVGVPRINSIIIVSVFLIVTAFIIWSNLIKMEEIASIKGFIKNKGSRNLFKSSYVAKIPESKIGTVVKGQSSRIKIQNLSDNLTLNGVITNIDNSLKTDKTGSNYYEAVVKLNSKENSRKLSELVFKNGKEINVDITTGERTLFKYLVSPVVKSVENSFKEE